MFNDRFEWLLGGCMFLALLFAIILFIYGQSASAKTKMENSAGITQLREGVTVYRVVDNETNCYVVVGELHGYTVAIDCVR